MVTVPSLTAFTTPALSTVATAESPEVQVIVLSEGTPTDKITKTVWASSNEEVATVADGVVTAVAEGQALGLFGLSGVRR